MMMICEETIIKLMRTDHKQTKLHSCLNKFNTTLYFHIAGNVQTDIHCSISTATNYSYFWGLLLAIFVKVVPQLYQ